MPYAGKQLQPRDVVALLADVWPTQKVIATAVALAESKGSLGAWHDNYDPTDGVSLLSRDCGLFQINIDVEQVAGPTEWKLRTESIDPDEYLPVAQNNLASALALYNTPWTRDGRPDKRRWQPWVAATSGWAWFPEWWVWHQEDGQPVGPWVPTGRYLQMAIRAVANWHLLIAQDMDSARALAEAGRLAKLFGIAGSLAWSARKAVYWASFPPKPESPPLDGVGPRPLQNDGRWAAHGGT